MTDAKRGRPSTYTPEMAAEICRLMVTEDPRTGRLRSVRQIAKLAGMPCRDTIYVWLLAHEEFKTQYSAAIDIRADALFDECLDISDDSSGDFVTRTAEDGAETQAPDHEHIARSRLRVDTRKWMTGKMAPKKYGDRVINNLLGANDGPIETRELTTDRQRARALAAFVAKTRQKP